MLFICLLVYFFLVFTFVWSTSVSAPRGLLNPLPLFCYRHLLVLTGYLLLALFWQAELSSSHSSTSSSSFLIAYFFLPHSLLFSLAVIWQLWCFLSLARKEDGESKRRLEKSSLYFFCNCPPTTLLTPTPPPTNLFKTIWYVRSLTQIHFDFSWLCARAWPCGAKQPAARRQNRCTTGPEGSQASVTPLEAFVLLQSVSALKNQTGWFDLQTWPWGGTLRHVAPAETLLWPFIAFLAPWLPHDTLRSLVHYCLSWN